MNLHLGGPNTSGYDNHSARMARREITYGDDRHTSESSSVNDDKFALPRRSSKKKQKKKKATVPTHVTAFDANDALS